MKVLLRISLLFAGLLILVFGCGTRTGEQKSAPVTRQAKEQQAYSMAEEAEDMAVMEQEPQPDWNTEGYERIVENRFVSPLKQPLSTFSVDVDRAAYANMRRFLNNNQMPPPDAIRMEELINYFDYDYPQPTGKHPFAIDMELGPCYWAPKHHILKIGLQGKKVDVSDLPASNLVFLLDVSGSMSDNNKLPLLKKALQLLLDELRPEDRVAIVVYAGAAGLVLESTSCENKEKIMQAMNSLSAGGSTAGGEGIKLAYKIAQDNFIEEGNNRVILATDGDFNVGASSDAAMERLIEEKRDDGVFLTVLGFGMGNYQDAKMEKLSNAGNGNYAYIDNILEAKKVLGKELWGTLYAIAKDVKIQIEFNPAKVYAYRLIGYENRMLEAEDFNDDKKDAGDIGSGHTVTALYEIIPPGTGENIPDVDELEFQKTETVESDDWLVFKLRYKQPDATESILIKKKLQMQARPAHKVSTNYQFASAVAEFGLLLRQSNYKGESSYAHVQQLAKQATKGSQDAYKQEFVRLVETAELLDEQ